MSLINDTMCNTWQRSPELLSSVLPVRDESSPCSEDDGHADEDDEGRASVRRRSSAARDPFTSDSETPSPSGGSNFSMEWIQVNVEEEVKNRVHFSLGERGNSVQHSSTAASRRCVACSCNNCCKSVPCSALSLNSFTSRPRSWPSTLPVFHSDRRDETGNTNKQNACTTVARTLLLHHPNIPISQPNP